MARRKNLRIILADAISEILERHDLTIPNCIRYVKPNLKDFHIRADTEISMRDWEIALELATLRKAQPTKEPQYSIRPSSFATPYDAEWRKQLASKLDYNHKLGHVCDADYAFRISILEQSSSKDNFFFRLREAIKARNV